MSGIGSHVASGTGEHDRNVEGAVTVAVVLASAGRPELLAQAIDSCSAQRGIDFIGVISVPDEASLPAAGPDPGRPDGWRIAVGTRGLAAQRNAGMAEAPEADLFAFFDDDALLRPDYLARAAAFLDTHPDVVALTGRVLLDGATRGEIPVETAVAALAASAVRPSRVSEPAPAVGDVGWSRTRELYGCNFVVRAEVARREGFDPRLPLYSWLEDHDFARRCLRHGVLARVDGCAIVHRGAASGGRQSHGRLGYSQVMNPVYLWRQGSFPAWLALQQIGRPLVKNVALALVGPHRRWRRQRLLGNARAAADALRGRITPERIVSL